MKKLIIISLLTVIVSAASTITAQDRQEDYLGLPGDNLNLYAVMRLFQESRTLEDFERNLNDQKSNINNLDLNGDNKVDYIKVFDDVDGEVHNIVLQIAVGPKENQDVAVFTVQRFDNGQVQIQLTGDEELYGKDYIIEPIFDEADSGGTPNPGYTENNRTVNGITVTYVKTSPVEIAEWSLVRFLFLPTYSPWRSAWYWDYYPNYWHPWHPHYWHYYYGYHYNLYHQYYGHYRRWNYHRYSRWNDFYYISRRAYSHDVNRRIVSGSYRTTYSRPEMRKEGEHMFAKNHPDQYRRSTEINSGNKSSTDRRSGHAARNKRSFSRNPSDGSTDVTRRTSTTVTNRTVGNYPSEKSTVSSRKSTKTVTNHSTTERSSKRNTTMKRTSEPSRSTGVNSSGGKPAKSQKSESAVKRSNSNKESDNKDSQRRK